MTTRWYWREVQLGSWSRTVILVQEETLFICRILLNGVLEAGLSEKTLEEINVMTPIFKTESNLYDP